MLENEGDRKISRVCGIIVIFFFFFSIKITSCLLKIRKQKQSEKLYQHKKENEGREQRETVKEREGVFG